MVDYKNDPVAYAQLVGKDVFALSSVQTSFLSSVGNVLSDEDLRLAKRVGDALPLMPLTTMSYAGWDDQMAHDLYWATYTPQCPARREGDEVVCPTCGLRWALDENRPECPK